MNKFTKVLSVFMILAAVTALCVSADTSYSTHDDPLVSLSYVDDVLAPQIVQQVMDKVEAEYVKVSDISSNTGSTYTYVTLDKDQTLMASSCCEVIILDGEATVIVTSASNIKAGAGINDLTSGTVLTNGSTADVSHYLVISKGDGRGFTASSDKVNILVRGEYNITG